QVELKRMEDIGVIRKVSHPTEWVNAIVVVAKKNGSIRVCLDPRPLNRAVRRAHYPLPTLTEIAARLQGARYFSKLDARSGYWMIQIDNESADLCTFGTPFGRYQFLRLPYGINCASEVFHARVRQLLEDLEGVDSFVDDIIVWGSTMAQHDERLKCLLERARQVGIKFNKEKCEFRVQEVSYLGHTFSAGGMAIDKNKLKAIELMPTPQDRPALERFLGMVNYLSKFITNYSEIASPLRSLLKKDVVWCWDEQHDNAVRQLKGRLCAAPVLALYAADEPVLLSVDASSHALGAVLLQAGRPVEFASSTLTDTQIRYAQIEKELLAIVFALERFHQYLFGRGDITVETDHKPLEALFNKPLDAVPARLQRMMLRIQGYRFKVVYKPGKYMFVADTLSRAPLPELMTSNVSVEVEEQSCFVIDNVRFSGDKINLVRKGVESDKECRTIIKYIKNGWPANKYDVDECVRKLWPYRECFEYIDNIILKDNLVYIPQSLRSEMINRVHEGHMGIDRCKRRARDVMFWPGMSRDVERAVRQCVTCAEHAPRPTREPMIPHKIPDLPWSKVGSDIFQYRNRNFLLLVDYFSNFIEVSTLNSIGSKAVIQAMKDQFARHGIPAQLLTDGGPAYRSKEFMEFRKKWGFEHIFTSPNYPQANGRSEKSVQTIKNYLIKATNSGSDFYLGLLNFRACPREGLASPAELLMGRRLSTRLPAYEQMLRPHRDNQLDYDCMLRKQAKSKSYYDQHSRALPELKPGENVVMVDEGRRKHAKVQSAAPQPRSYFVT
ncbi:jg24630, partial [Pararge aegeria aegeria]